VEKQKNYSQMVATAELAVSSVKDPELRRVAFQKVLEDLLSTNEKQSTGSAPLKHSAKGKTKAASQQVARAGTKAYIEELANEGFFSKQQTIANVKAELENRGHHIPLTSLSGPLQRLCQEKTLRRQRIKVGGKRQTFGYSNW
jgi:hypothetical protein